MKIETLIQKGDFFFLGGGGVSGTRPLKPHPGLSVTSVHRILFARHEMFFREGLQFSFELRLGVKQFLGDLNLEAYIMSNVW